MVIDKIAIGVNRYIKTPPPQVQNVREFCKKDFCWANLKGSIHLDESPNDYGISSSEKKEVVQNARSVRKIDEKLGPEIFISKILENPKDLLEIDDIASRHKLHNPDTRDGIRKLRMGNINLSWKAKNDFVKLVKTIDETFHKNFYKE